MWPPYSHSWGMDQGITLLTSGGLFLNFLIVSQEEFAHCEREPWKEKSKNGSWKMGGLILLSSIKTSCNIIHPEFIFVAVARPLCCCSPTSAAYIHSTHAEVAVITSPSHARQRQQRCESLGINSYCVLKIPHRLPGVGFFHHQTFLDFFISPASHWPKKPPWSLLG